MKTKDELSKLPKEIIEKYDLAFRKDYIAVHNPSHINIYYDEEVEIENSGVETSIRNSKVKVTLWRNTFLMHVVVF